jgi:hypothetical protein
VGPEGVRSLPGLGTILGARVLGEFGDAPGRYATVLARHVRNKRLADAIYLWAFASLTASPGARTFYDQRRTDGTPTTRPG